MSRKKTISDLLDALTESMSDRDIAKSVIKSEISSAIISARLSESLSQAELAQKIGKTQSAISKWEAGDTNFSIDLLVDIAADLNLDLTVKLVSPSKKIRRAKASPSYQTIPNNKIINFPTGYATPNFYEDLLEI